MGPWKATLVSVLRRGTPQVDECWVAVDGDLDDLTSQSLREQLGVLLEEGCGRLGVDLRHTVTIGSSGMRVLIDTMRQTEERGGTLIVRPPPGGVYKLGRARLLAELLAVADDAVDDARDIHRLDRLVSDVD